LPASAAGRLARVVERRLFESPVHHEVREPIQYGIGIHAGEVIVRDIGFRGHTVFTALGDCVSVAARLQDTTKSLS